MMRRLVLMLLFATAARAHDFWIEPSTFHPAPGDVVSVGLRVGQHLSGDPIPRSASLIASFVVRENGVERPVSGFENRDPAGFVRFVRPGAAVIAYTSKPYPLELSQEKYREFLQQEGFETVRADGVRREQFSRFAKAYFGATTDNPFGWRFEIVPEDLNAGRVRVLLDGKPFCNALVTALQPGTQIALRTDRQGRVALPLARRGMWMIKCVALTETETLWASVTFER